MQNTLTERPTLIRLVPALDVPGSGWRVALNPSEVILGANDCPKEIEVELIPPTNATVGSTGRVHVAAVTQTFTGPVVLGGVSVQGTMEKDPNTLEIDFTDIIQVNEQSVQIGGNGTALLNNGAVIINIKADNFIEGYPYWPVNWGIGILSGILPAVSLQHDDAHNLLTLTDGKLGYKARVTISDEFANIITDIKVSRQKGAIVAVLNSRGKAKYPHLVSLGPEPIILIQKPNPKGGFTETGEIQFVTDKGKTIKSSVKIEYFDVKLLTVQRREVTIKALEISDDQRKVTLVGRSVVKKEK